MEIEHIQWKMCVNNKCMRRDRERKYQGLLRKILWMLAADAYCSNISDKLLRGWQIVFVTISIFYISRYVT